MSNINEEMLFCSITDVDAALIEESDSPMEPARIIRPRFKKLIAVAAAAVFAVTLGVTAAATGLFTEGLNTFAALFGGEPTQVELIEKMGSPVGVSDTRNGITVTAEASMNDGANVLVLFSVQREDGTALIPEDAVPGGSLIFGCTEIESAQTSVHFNRGMNRFLDGAPGETSAHFLGYFESVDGVPEKLEWAANSLEYVTTDKDGCAQVLELCDPHDPERELAEPNYDVWQLAFSTGGQNVGTTLYPDGVSALRVSPFAVTIELSEGQGASLDEQDLALSLRTKDGREIDLSAFTDTFGNTVPAIYCYTDENGDTVVYRAGTFLPEIIPVEDMDCVIFNGTIIPIE